MQRTVRANTEMRSIKQRGTASHGRSLASLCALVTSMSCAYEDVAELIEDKAYEQCDHGKLECAQGELQKVAAFFETLQNKNEENSRDLADIYLLVGQLCQFAGRFDESITWFTKAVIVDDQYSTPYHNLAISYLKLCQLDSAIKCLDQEILIAPGNYYSYLLLVDLYEKENRPEDAETVLKQLLMRNPSSIQGLHRLIRHYERHSPDIDVEMLSRRLLRIKRRPNRIEAVIRAHYLCRKKRFQETLDFIDSWHRGAPEVTIVHLVKAFVFGEMRQYTKKRWEISAFKERNHGRIDVMLSKLQEFGSIFGEIAAKRLGHRLSLSIPDWQPGSPDERIC